MVAKAIQPPVGKILGGKYRVDKEVGRGGMATIYAAENVDIGKPVAVKVLAAELARSRTVTERFLREARAAARVRSPHICEVYDAGTFQGQPFIVMELLHGESLYDRLARERRLTSGDTLRIASDVCRGLSLAHSRAIVHRDLKPENIFLTRAEDGTLQTKVVDFGLAKFYEPTSDPKLARLTKDGALFGTPAYMSPEQANAKGSVDHRSDLWALGCIVYEMLTGRTVWDVEQGVAMTLAQVATKELPFPSKYAPSLPVAFEEWFRKALAREPEYRFQSADEFRRALRATLVDSGTPYTGNLSGPHQPTTPVPRLGSLPTPTAMIDGTAAFSNPKPVQDTGQPPLADTDAGSVATSLPKARPSAKWPLAIIGIIAGLGLVWIIRTRATPNTAESAPHAEQIARAQGLVEDGDSAEAAEQLRQVFKQSRGKAARSLMSHVSAVVEAKKGDCTLIGIGHPRPFSAESKASKATLFSSSEHPPFAVWADATGPDEPVQARTSQLDSALRRTTQPASVTPEAESVREPTLFGTDQGIGLIYWDMGTERAGAYARRLTSSGLIDSRPILISTQRPGHPYYPTIASAEDGGFWVAWVEPTRARVNDIFVRKLNKNLEPVSAPVAITAYAPSRGKVQADRPSLAIHQGLLHIAFVVRRGNNHEVVLVRTPATSALEGKSAIPKDGTAEPGDEELDRFLGQALKLSKSGGGHNRASVACAPSGCFVAWDEATVAARLVFVENDGSVRWREQLAKQDGTSARPSVATFGEHAVVAWFDATNVYAAPLTPNAVGTRSVVGRVSAVMRQPQPTWTRSNQNNEWYLSWRSYESAVPEPFVAKIRCN